MSLIEASNEVKNEGKSLMWIILDHKVIALMSLKDEIKANGKKAII